MDDETPREKWAGYLGAAVTIGPALVVSGFMPDWNVLPFAAWVAIASVGAAIAGAIATPMLPRGAIAGAVTGAGVIIGIWAYVAARSAITGYNTFFSLELAIPFLLGGAPGLLLYTKWARPKSTYGAGQPSG